MSTGKNTGGVVAGMNNWSKFLTTVIWHKTIIIVLIISLSISVAGAVAGIVNAEAPLRDYIKLETAVSEESGAASGGNTVALDEIAEGSQSPDEIVGGSQLSNEETWGSQPPGENAGDGKESETTSVVGSTEAGISQTVDENEDIEIVDAADNVKADFAQEDSPQADFTNGDFSDLFADVNKGDWYYSAVRYAYEHELMLGMFPEIFNPDTPLTRAMAITAIYRLENLINGTGEIEYGETKQGEFDSRGIGSGVNQRFPDVAEDTWYFDAVSWAAASGVVLGYGEGGFGPDDRITRQDIVVMLNRYADLQKLNLPAVKEKPQFYDEIDITSYARESVERFYKAGVVSGKLANSFDPLGNATRAELAAVMMGLMASMDTKKI